MVNTSSISGVNLGAGANTAKAGSYGLNEGKRISSSTRNQYGSAANDPSYTSMPKNKFDFGAAANDPNYYKLTRIDRFWVDVVSYKDEGLEFF